MREKRKRDLIVHNLPEPSDNTPNSLDLVFSNETNNYDQ